MKWCTRKIVFNSFLSIISIISKCLKFVFFHMKIHSFTAVFYTKYARLKCDWLSSMGYSVAVCKVLCQNFLHSYIYACFQEDEGRKVFTVFTFFWSFSNEWNIVRKLCKGTHWFIYSTTLLKQKRIKFDVKWISQYKVAFENRLDSFSET